MTTAIRHPSVAVVPDVDLPTHLDLPDRDGSLMINCQEHPQSALMSGSLNPRLWEVQPDGQFAICADVGIYWRPVANEPLRGCKAPDWFCVLGVPPMLDGEFRRSYVMWQEGIAPMLIIEYVSTDGAEEHDRTANTGKFWVYERMIRSPFYVIFDRFRETLEVFRHDHFSYLPAAPNERGRFPIEPLGIELGLWHGTYLNCVAWWVRAWDARTGQLLPSAEEMAEQQRQRADRAEADGQRLSEILRAAGIDPDAA